MNNKELKLGLIGLSKGNGHPYSWAAIFNGYDKKQMENCGFPVIPRYLEKEDFPKVCINNAKVTHLWTQDKNLSKHISKACYIENIVENYIDMIGKVDAILLARDDANNHFDLAVPFINNKIPIYIDKPLAYNLKEAKKLMALEKYKGQIFSCSAFKFAPELKLIKENLSGIGKIKLIKGFVPKNWENYAIHVIDPILHLKPDLGILRKKYLWKNSDRHTLLMEFDDELEIHIESCGVLNCPIGINIFGSKSSIRCEFKDTFNSFRNTLKKFIFTINNNQLFIDKKILLKSIEIVEAGIK